MTKNKNSNCKIIIIKKIILWKNLRLKLWKTKNLKWWQNSKTQIVLLEYRKLAAQKSTILGQGVVFSTFSFKMSIRYLSSLNLPLKILLYGTFLSQGLNDFHSYRCKLFISSPHTQSSFNLKFSEKLYFSEFVLELNKNRVLSSWTVRILFGNKYPWHSKCSLNFPFGFHFRN